MSHGHIKRFIFSRLLLCFISFIKYIFSVSTKRKTIYKAREFSQLWDSQPHYWLTSFSCFIALWKHTCRPIKTHVLSKLFYKNTYSCFVALRIMLFLLIVFSKLRNNRSVLISVGLEISEILGKQFSVPCIRFTGNCRKPTFCSVNFDQKSLFFIKKTIKEGLDFIV